jgi:hypothetical protein
MNNEVEIIVTSRDHTGPGWDAATRRADGFGGTMRRIGDSIAGAFSRGVSNAVKTGTELFSGFFRSASAKAAEAGTNIAASLGTAAVSTGGMTAATGGLNLLLAALLGIAAAVPTVAAGFVALAPALLAVGGLAGAGATATVGLAAAVATLKLGLSGLGEALAAHGKGAKEFNKALKELSPAGREMAKVLVGLQDDVDRLRRRLQQKLLVGLSDEVKELAGRWMPALRRILGDTATSFNRIGKSVIDALGRRDFIINMRDAAGAFNKMLDRIGLSLDDLIDAFGRLAGSSGPVLEKIGDLLGGVIEKFSRWIRTADKSGKLDSFMQKAADTLQTIWSIGGQVFGIIGELVEILFPGSERASEGLFDGVQKSLEKLREWLDDPKNQQAIRDFIDKILDGIGRVVAWFEDPKNQEKIREWFSRIGDLAAAIGDAADTIADLVDKVGGWIDAVEGWVEDIGDIPDVLRGVWDEVSKDAREKWNVILAFFRTLPGKVVAAIAAMPARVASIMASMAGRAVAAIASLPARIRAVFVTAAANAAATVTTMATRVVTTMGTIPGRAVAALGRIGGVLYNAGRSLINGLIEGIRSKVPDLEGTLNWVSSKIPDWKGPEELDRKLLEPAGREIMGGLLRGIGSRVPDLQTQLGNVTDAITTSRQGSTHAAPAVGQAGVTINVYPQGSILAERDVVAIVRDALLTGAFRGLVQTP